MADTKDKTEDAELLKEVKERFTRCEDWEAESRKKFVEDLKFANADPDNGWQWDNTLKSNREADSKPCLTINKTRQHNLQITNDAKQNKPGVNIRPVGDGASYDAAQVYEGIVRHIEYQSNAEQAYDTATMFQVQGGIGYWRVVTDYVDDDSFDQEIYIRRVKNPLAVYLDPDITETDGSDARFGFVYDDCPTDKFKAENPDHADMVSTTTSMGPSNWAGSDHVRICEYYRKTQKPDKLIAFVIPMPYVGAGQQIIARESKMDEDQKRVFALVKDADTTVTRDIVTDEIMWYKIAGEKVIDSRPWPGKYIPIVRVVGEETIIEDKLDRKGHTRSMKDAQRMYNYWTSEATAQVALQTKTPYIAPAEAIENYEEYWKDANTSTASVLPYNSVSEGGGEIPRPQREQPPVMATAYVQGMQMAQDQMMMSSGQYQSQFGQNENATSGKAINERQRQGDNATYHFIDGLAVGIRFTGKILIDLIPKIYDTQRVVQILAKDGTETHIQVDPSAGQAYQEEPAPQDGSADPANPAIAAIFNPNVGRYEVESDIGPGYATRRQEAFNAMTTIASQNQKFMDIAGDLLFKSADFPLADELAERYKRIIPPAVMGDGPAPEVQQMQQTIQHLQDTIVQLNKKLTDKDTELDIRGYDATTKRLTAIGNSGPAITPDQVAPAFHQLLMQMMQQGSPEGPSQPDIGEPPAQPPVPPQPQPQPMGAM